MARNSFDIVMEDRKKLVNRIIENIEKGELIFNKGWDSQILMPQNPTSKVNYIGGNRIRLIAESIDKGYKDLSLIHICLTLDKEYIKNLY